jgi:hypothetical protein
MSLNNLIREHVASVFLNTDHFAETVIRYPLGERDRHEEVTGIVTWSPTVVTDTRGRGYTRRCELFLNDSVTVAASDAFKIGQRRCEVEAIDEAQDGARVVHLVHYESETKGLRRAGDV